MKGLQKKLFLHFCKLNLLKLHLCINIRESGTSGNEVPNLKVLLEVVPYNNNDYQNRVSLSLRLLVHPFVFVYTLEDLQQRFCRHRFDLCVRLR